MYIFIILMRTRNCFKTSYLEIKFVNYDRGLCLLDPYGLTLDWRVVELIGKSNVIDLFINFPVMDMNRKRNMEKSKRSKVNNTKT